MNTLNKRQMMLAISVSLTAYAFAITGCGQKDAPNKASKSENLAAIESLAGTWVSDEQAVKAGQKNLNFVTITKNSMKLRALCAIDAKDDKTPAINAVAEVSNDFSVEAKNKNIKFKAAKAFKADATADCAVNLKDGDIQYTLDGDKLTLGVTADGTATDSKKAIKDVGMVFKKVTDDEAKTRETDFKAKSAAGVAAAVAKQDPNAPASGTVADKATKDAIAKADLVNAPLLAGPWLLQEDDSKVKADKDLSKILTKSNVDLIIFVDTRFNERIACRYQAVADATGQNILELGFKLNKIDNDDSTNVLDVTTKQTKTSGLSFESVLNESSIKITQAHGGTPSSPFPSDFIKLTTAQQDLASCQLTYNADQKISFDISGDGKTLTLKDDKNGTRKFKKIVKSNLSESDKSALALIERKSGDSKASADAKAADDDSNSQAPDATSVTTPTTTTPPSTTVTPPASTTSPATTTTTSADATAAAAVTAPAATTPTTPTTTSSAGSVTPEAASHAMVQNAAAGQAAAAATAAAKTPPAATAPAASTATPQLAGNPRDRR